MTDAAEKRAGPGLCVICGTNHHECQDHPFTDVGKPLPQPSPPPHPEDTCEDCGGKNPVWFAPNEIWNRAVPHRSFVLCPLCFIIRAEAAGIKTTAWELRPEQITESEPSPPSAAPDKNCMTLPNGDCVGRDCMHDATPPSAAPLVFGIEHINIEREADGRWIAEYENRPGVMCYGPTRREAINNMLNLLESMESETRVAPQPAPLFKTGSFQLHSGEQSNFKIDCDALSDFDWASLAYMVADRVGKFSSVEGVPQGGLKLAEKLQVQVWSEGPVLIVDDVLTTGASMEQQRAGRDAIGAVVFARSQPPAWVTPLFILAPQPAPPPCPNCLYSQDACVCGTSAFDSQPEPSPPSAAPLTNEVNELGEFMATKSATPSVPLAWAEGCLEAVIKHATTLLKSLPGRG